MAQTTNYAEIQRDELEALRSIYMQDFEENEIKTGAWNKFVDRSFKLKIKAASDSKSDVAMTLMVSLPATYPKTIPRLSLSFSEGVPPKTIKAAETLISAKPRTLLGSEMIFEIATSLQDVLEQYTDSQPTDDVVPEASRDHIPNLHQERAIQEAAMTQKVRHAEEEKQLAQKEAEEEDQRVISFMIDQEKARMTNRKSKQPATPDPFEVQETGPDGLQFDQPITIKDFKGTITTFHTVHQKIPYREGIITKVSIVRPLGYHAGSGIILALKECSIPDQNDEGGRKKGIQDLESKLDLLKHLQPHPNIQKLLNFNIERSMEGGDEPASGGWNVSILTLLAEKGSVKGLCGILNVEIIRSWAMQLLEGLDFLHQNGVVHAKVHVGNIILDEAETGNTTVRLSDGGYQHDLYSLNNRSSVNYLGVESIHWSAPEVISNSHGRPVAATDIWDLGVALLQMIFGLTTQSQHISPNALLVSLDMSQPTEDFFEQTFVSDPKKRKSAFDLKLFEFFRTEEPVLREAHSPRLTSENIAAASLSGSVAVAPRRDSIAKSASYSWYLNNFVEIGRLGRGGYGEVVKAKHKLENQVYAIKKIKQNSASALAGVLSEIVMLSKLNHPNVVRYFTAWTETEGQRPESALSSSSRSSLSLTNGDPNGLFAKSSGGLDFIGASDGGIEFGYSDDDDDESPNSRAIADGDSVKGNDKDYGEQNSEESEDDSPSEESDDEEYEEESDSDEDNDVAPPRRRHSSSYASEASIILYIQMQYCEKQTLRDFIRNGLPSNTKECWRLFRQILYGLVHIHESSIVHRDLKPENIFIDNQNDVRIGDFGLARPGDQVSTKLTGQRNACASFTKSIGTAYYIAPEVRSTGKGKYNEKADMYALGIILFEMCYQMDTGMERAQNLTKIRKEDHCLPRVFEEPEKSVQGEIILSLINHRPSERPSSSDILASGKIPALPEDESIRAVLRDLRDPQSRLRFDLLGAMFADHDNGHDEKDLREQDPEALQHSNNSIEDKNWNGSDSEESDPDPVRILEELTFEIANPQYGPEELQVHNLVKARLASVFCRHGAIDLSGPLVHPYSSFYSNSTNAVFKLLRRNNKMMQAPYDLTLPRAKHIAYDANPPRRSFTFGDVFRDTSEGEIPRIINEVDFDIVSFSKDHHAVHEAEIIKVVDEVIEAIPSVSAVQLCYHLNHSFILDSILKFCQIDKFKRPAVKEELSKLHFGDWTWAKLKRNLRAPPLNIAATSLAELSRFDFRDEVDQAVGRLQSMLPTISKLGVALAHLQKITGYLGHFNVKRKIYLNPLSSFNEKFYRGEFLFQCIYDKKERDVFAAGGRYDRLIRHFRNNPKQGNRYAVGFSMNWKRLCPSMVRFHQKAAANMRSKKAVDLEIDDFWTLRRCDVLVDSSDPDLLLTTGMKILAELWSIGVKAELGLDLDSQAGLEGPTSQSNKEAKAATYTWIILIKKDGTLKIKDLIRKEETELSKPELVGWLRSEIRDRDKDRDRERRHHHERAKLPRHSSNQDNTSHQASDRDHPDVRILMSSNKGKKINHKIIMEEAHSQMQELAMVAAIETKDEFLEMLKTTRLNDVDSWKRFIQNNGGSPSDRQYLGQVHQLLKDMSKEAKPGATHVFIYNFRTKNCITYDLGTTNF